MSRLSVPTTIEATPAESRPILEEFRNSLGSLPNLFRLVAHSPAALAGYAGLSAALETGALDPQTRERIAIAIAHLNGCSYCLAAHTYIGHQYYKLDEREIAANRTGTSLDKRSAAAVKFAVRAARERGHVSDEDLRDVKAAGYSEGEIVEIVLHVALNTFTNLMNEVAKTEIDFPSVTAS